MCCILREERNGQQASRKAHSTHIPSQHLYIFAFYGSDIPGAAAAAAGATAPAAVDSGRPRLARVQVSRLQHPAQHRQQHSQLQQVRWCGGLFWGWLLAHHDVPRCCPNCQVPRAGSQARPCRALCRAEPVPLPRLHVNCAQFKTVAAAQLVMHAEVAVQWQDSTLKYPSSARDHLLFHPLFTRGQEGGLFTSSL